MKIVLTLVVFFFCLFVCVSSSRPLNLREGAPVDDVFVAKITALEQDELEFVENRLVSKLHISQEEAALYKLEFQRWVSLNFLINSTSAAATKGPFVPSLQVDEFWHNFILYTKKYSVWCHKHFNHFIHHVPEEETTEPAVTQHNDDWMKTVALMKDLYGANWLTAVHEDGTCGSCHSIQNDASCGGGCTTSAGCSSTTSSIKDNNKGGCGNCGTGGSCSSQ